MAEERPNENENENDLLTTSSKNPEKEGLSKRRDPFNKTLEKEKGEKTINGGKMDAFLCAESEGD